MSIIQIPGSSTAWQGGFNVAEFCRIPVIPINAVQSAQGKKHARLPYVPWRAQDE